MIIKEYWITQKIIKSHSSYTIEDKYRLYICLGEVKIERQALVKPKLYIRYRLKLIKQDHVYLI